MIGVAAILLKIIAVLFGAGVILAACAVPSIWHALRHPMAEDTQTQEHRPSPNLRLVSSDSHTAVRS